MSSVYLGVYGFLVKSFVDKGELTDFLGFWFDIFNLLVHFLINCQVHHFRKNVGLFVFSQSNGLGDKIRDRRLSLDRKWFFNCRLWLNSNNWRNLLKSNTLNFVFSQIDIGLGRWLLWRYHFGRILFNLDSFGQILLRQFGESWWIFDQRFGLRIKFVCILLVLALV